MNEMMGNWIETFTGKKFYPLAPRVSDVGVADIAHALSLTCRFTGHCRVFYSVAEHSIRVSNILPPGQKLAGLLHDAAEAYIADIASPVKSDAMRNAEHTILAAVFLRFGVWNVDWAAIKEADYILLATEVRDLMHGTPGWYLPEKPLEDKIVPVAWQAAEVAFLEAFHVCCVSDRRTT